MKVLMIGAGDIARSHARAVVKLGGSIAGAAAHSGFSSAATFQRNFRRIMGISPKEWKKSPENYQGRLAQYRITYYDGWE